MRSLEAENVQSSIEGICIKEEPKELGEKFQTLINLMPDPIVIVDRKGKFLAVNDRIEEETGFKREELLGKNFLRTEIVTAKSKAILVKNLAKRMMGMHVAPYEIEGLTKDGRKLPFEVNAAKIQYEGRQADLVIFRDITERKKAEEALRESEEKFRNLAEQSPNMIFINKKGRVVYANEKCEEFMGFKREELCSPHFNFLTLIAPQYRDLVKSNFSRHMKGEEVAPYEYALITKEGKRIEAILASKLIRYGRENAILGIVTDITERKNAEKAIRESREKFERLFMDNPEAAVYLDPDFHILDVNPRFEELFGYSLDEIRGKHINVVVVPKDKMAEAKTLDENARKGYVYHDTFRKRKDGSLVPVSISAAPIIVEGQPIGYVGLYKDITERKQMEERLRQYSEHLEELVEKRTEELLESEKRYSVLVEEASDGVAILQDGKIILSNKKVTEITGYSRDELIDFPFEKLVKIVDEKYRQLIMRRYTRRLKGKAVPVTQEIELVSKNGECVPIEIGGTVVHFQGRPAILIIVRDIRERKRMEEERLRLEKLAAIGKVATMVGHDLRNPLQSIENAAYYLHNELSRFPSSIPISPQTMKMLKVLNDSVDYADRVIRDLQDFSATKRPILNNTNVNTIVRETLSQVEVPENVKLITQLGRLPKIKADNDMIRRVFLNLTMNGIQAMENGGTLKVSTKKRKDLVEISLEDTGTGISEENKEKLFTPFFTTKARGMGMGLAICKKFVDAHGGSIEVESEERKGSTFTVKLPIKKENGGENNE